MLWIIHLILQKGNSQIISQGLWIVNVNQSMMFQERSQPKKLFTSLSLSSKGNKFKRIPFQVDTAAACNPMPLDVY